MRVVAQVSAAPVLLAAAWLLAAAAPVAAQSALERPPNLSGGWTDRPGTLHFHIVHRFDVVGEVNRLVASPTFLLAGGVPYGGLLGVRYASSSDVRTPDPQPRPNEFEAFARWRLPLGSDAPVRAAVQAGFNTAVSSWDGEATVSGGAGPVTLVSSFRAFGKPYGGDEARYAAGAGVVVRTSRHTGIAGDVVSLLDREGAERIGWSAGLLLGIPYSPHTLSLHATNLNTGTLQGGSRGRRDTRWGFEFTVPITPARLVRRPPAAAEPRPEPEPAARVEATGDTVRAYMEDFRFAPARLEIAPGTTVVWTNRGDELHNAVATDGTWGSPLLERGESWSHTFREPGRHDFFCEPHPFMQGVIVVSEPAAAPSGGPGPADHSR